MEYAADVDMNRIEFRGRDFVLSLLLSIPLGAIVAALVGALSSVSSPLLGAVALIGAFLGLFLGPLAAFAGLIAYGIARRLRVHSRWTCSILVAAGSGISMVILLVAFVASTMPGFVSETIDGRASNPWMDAAPAFPIVFVAGFAPAFIWFFSCSGYRIKHPVVPAVVESVPAGQS